MYISMMTLDSMGFGFTWLILIHLNISSPCKMHLLWFYMQCFWLTVFVSVTCPYTQFRLLLYLVYLYIYHVIFFNESLLKSHSTMMQFMYGDAFNRLVTSWKFDSINFKWQTSLKGGGLETQTVLFEAVPCTIRQVTKRMHSVTVTKGISLTALLLEGHFMLYSLTARQLASHERQSGVFTKVIFPK